jgi:glycosyltransferase involved in cell wall biosynthesis/Tfp pilus assembly protein PilF
MTRRTPKTPERSVRHAQGRGAPTISACLIVKDEEANLPRCLASLQGKVDQIVVVDTGSTDRTVELAEKQGAKVFHFAWCDDFSAARNESLRLATGDWLLWIDADEELVERHPGALRELLAAVSGPWGFFLEQRSPRTDAPDGPATVVKQWRLFPHKKGIRFEGRVHEHPVAPRPIAPTDVLEQTAVFIRHWGYLPNAEVMARKLARNRRLIELSITAEPNQPRHYFNLGMQLLVEGNSRRALDVLRRGIDLWFEAHGLDLGYVPGMFAAAAKAAANLGDDSSVIEIERRTPPELVSSELLLESGRAWRRLGQPHEAATRFERAAGDPLAIANILHDPTCVEQARAELHDQGPTVSACMILRDEERDLPRCLASLKGAVDEIVVVDTGSTDRTVEIATAAGARVFHFDWVDDFSAARNESLRHARGDFILWIDGDDELREAQPGALRRLCRDMPDSAWAYWVDVVCPTDEWGEGEATLKQCRILRNHAGIQFHGRLHEQAAPPPHSTFQTSGSSGLAHQNQVSIYHWGYIPTAESGKDRSERNLRLLRLAVDEHPDDAFQHHNLGLQLLADKRFEEAWQALTRAIQVWRDHPPEHDGFVPAMFGLAATAAMELGCFEDVLAVEAQTPPHYVCSELLLPAGIACWRLGRPLEAIARFQRAISDTAAINTNNHDRGSSTWRPELHMACVCTELADYAAAYEHARKALDFAPTRPEALFVLAHVSHMLGNRQEALHWARQLLAGSRDDGYKAQTRALLLRLANEADDGALALEALDGPVDKLPEVEALVVRSRAYALLGDLQRQYETLDAGCRQFPEYLPVRLELAELLESQGYAAEATNVLGAALDLPDASAELYQRLGKLLARQGRLEDASNALKLAKLKASSQAAAA